MTGTLINVGAIIVGSLLGLFFKKGISPSITGALDKVQGLSILIIALNGIIAAMFTVDPATGKLSDSGGLLLFISLVLGCVIGEGLRLDDRFETFGRWVEGKMKAEGFGKGFITASLLYSIGAMSIIGPLNDGLRGDFSILAIKSGLDGVISIMLAATLGYGVLFSAIPVLICEGSVALLARQIAPYISDTLLNLICMVGYAIVLAIGVNFLFSTKIKTANLLPAIVIPILYYFIFLA